MSRKMIYRKVLIALLAVSVAGLMVFHYQEEKSRIPDSYTQTKGEDMPKNPSFWVTAEVLPQVAEASIGAYANNHYTISYKYLGVIPLKETSVEVVQPQLLIPGGVPVGIYVETAGVMVIGTGKVEGADGLTYEPALEKVQPGDYIQAVNGAPISEKEDLIEVVQEGKGEVLLLDLEREGKEIQVEADPIATMYGDYKLGIWVRDNTQGVGTLTFLTEDGKFGALGHGVSDVDTGKLLNISEGRLYDTRIVDIKKGESGKPGEVSGVIRYRSELKCGELLKNTAAGIFGDASERLYDKVPGERIQIGYKQEVELGPAWVRNSLGGTVRDYQIEIVSTNCKETELNKGIVFKVTDPELLELAGGIVQGMSGSPIIQDGKLVGAVTHVLVNDPARGYGIFIENMLEATE